METLFFGLKLFLPNLRRTLLTIDRTTMIVKWTVSLAISIILINKAISSPVQNKTQQGAAASPSDDPKKNPVPVKKKPSRVIDVFKAGHGEKDDKNRDFAGIGDLIVVKVDNLQELIRKSKCLDDNDSLIESSKCTPQKIMLYLDGRQIDGISPESGAPSPDEQKLRFRLNRAVDTNDKIWADLLGAPPIGRKFFKRPTEVSVGLENQYPIPTDVKADKFKIVRIRESWFWFSSVTVIFLLYFLSMLAVKSDILRDSGPIGKDATGKEIPKPYSLARCQMAFWFFWVVASFVYLWLITGAYDIITSEALALIGIGAATALGSATIDSSKTAEVTAQQNSLEADKSNLENELTILNSSMNSDPPPANLAALGINQASIQTRLSLINSQLASLAVSTNPKPSIGWLNDILMDNTGISFHRFQIVVWTFVLGILFVFSVWNRLSMPEFGATLLALQGISAATYVGFKIPEKQA